LIRACYACGGDVQNFPEYYRCWCCGLIRTIYNYDSSIYSKDYADNYEKYSHSAVNDNLMLFRLGMVARYVPCGSRLLDFGTALGIFLEFAQPYYKCEGIEPNTEAVKLARVGPIHSGLNGLGKFKAITFFDVLEHIEEPKELLRLMKIRYLEPRGYLFITTPNAECVTTAAAVASWKHYKPKEHLFLYTKNSLSAIMRRLGFEVVHWGHEESAIRPGNSRGDLLTCVAQVKD
jgi:Methyltransferase domain